MPDWLVTWHSQTRPITTPPALTVSRKNIKVRELFEDPSYLNQWWTVKHQRGFLFTNGPHAKITAGKVQWKRVPKQKNIAKYKDETSCTEHMLRTFTQAWHAVGIVWKDSVFTAPPESRLASRSFQTCNTILHFDRVQGRGQYACSIDQHIYMCITPAGSFAYTCTNLGLSGYSLSS